MDTLLSGVTLVTMNNKMDVLFGAYLGVTDGKISYIGKTPPEEKPETILDGTGMVAIPGLVNCHTHLTQTIFRGLWDDTPSGEALEDLLQKESKMDHRSAKTAALLGIAECLRFGITSVSDLSGFPEAVAEAAAEAGIKANVALAAHRFVDDNEDFDFETDEACQTLCRTAEKWHGYDGGRIRVDAGIYAEYTSNHQLWEALSDYAAEKGLGMQLHMAQTQQEAVSCEDRTGLSAGELLSCHRLFRVPAQITDCAFTSPEEQKLLAKYKATAVATPLSAAKSGRKSTPVSACVKAGMNVALGTGGAPDCGNLDLFEVMRSTAMAERLSAGSPDKMPAAALLMMATTCGARAQGRSERTGMLEVGMDADLALIDFSAPHLMPCHNVLSTLVFGAKGGDVAMTMVQGKILYENGRFPTLNLTEVVSDLTGYAMEHVFGETRE